MRACREVLLSGLVLCIIDAIGLLRDKSEFHVFDEMPKTGTLCTINCFQLYHVFAFVVLRIVWFGVFVCARSVSWGWFS